MLGKGRAQRRGRAEQSSWLCGPAAPHVALDPDSHPVGLRFLPALGDGSRRRQSFCTLGWGSSLSGSRRLRVRLVRASRELWPAGSLSGRCAGVLASVLLALPGAARAREAQSGSSRSVPSWLEGGFCQAWAEGIVHVFRATGKRLCFHLLPEIVFKVKLKVLYSRRQGMKILYLEENCCRARPLWL